MVSVHLLADQQEDNRKNTAGNVLSWGTFLCWALHFSKAYMICLQVLPLKRKEKKKNEKKMKKKRKACGP